MKGERTMDEQRKPRSREKKVVNEGKGVEKRGEGLGTGPVNNTGSYEDRRQQQSASQASPFGNMNQRPASCSPGTGACTCFIVTPMSLWPIRYSSVFGYMPARA